MNLLLDTNVFLRLVLDKTRLSAAATEAIADEKNEIWVSAVCAWEIAIKFAIGKLQLFDLINEVVAKGMAAVDALELPIRMTHCIHVASLPLHHRNPFDRILIAQAQVESLTIVTSDQHLTAYGVPILW